MKNLQDGPDVVLFYFNVMSDVKEGLEQEETGVPQTRL